MDKELFKELLIQAIEKERWYYELENTCICGCCPTEYAYVDEDYVSILVDSVFAELESNGAKNG